jgi:hypothetical protein
VRQTLLHPITEAVAKPNRYKYDTGIKTSIKVFNQVTMTTGARETEDQSRTGGKHKDMHEVDHISLLVRRFEYPIALFLYLFLCGLDTRLMIHLVISGNHQMIKTSLCYPRVLLVSVFFCKTFGIAACWGGKRFVSSSFRCRTDKVAPALPVKIGFGLMNLA